MKRMALALAAGSLAFGGCAGNGNVPQAPGEFAERTVLDEQALGAIELAYKAARLAGEVAVDAGLIDGETATRVAAIDRQAFASVQLARRAYEAGNADTYATAISRAQTAVTALLALTGGDGR